MTIEEVAHYLFELLLALRELKQLGIYHRDIKPANFLYNRETKRGRLIDFGLAEIDGEFVSALEKRVTELREDEDPEYIAQERRLEHYWRIRELLKSVGTQKLGTESYMPLESLLMMKQQSYSSDIWPVGVILLQCATRRYSVLGTPVYPIKGVHNSKDMQLVQFILQLGCGLGREKVVRAL